MLLCAVLALIPLVSILVYVGKQGLPGLTLEFLTAMPKPLGEPGGGMANAIVGSILMVTLASAMAIPLGVLAGIYLSEYGNTRMADAIRFGSDVLAGVPSIVVGVFVYALAVLPVKHFSGFAGSLALAVIMLPTVTRTTEAVLRLVPVPLREGALALGATQWRAILTVVVPAALPGIVTGAMLAIARAAGETAPLLFTALGNRFWSTDMSQPMASLPVQIYTYAISPYEEWHRQAWTGALVLILLVLATSIAARRYVRARTTAR